MPTISEIRDMIESNNIEPETDIFLYEGKLANNSKEKEIYYIYHGFDPVRANLCDSSWGEFNLELIAFIKDQNYSKEKMDEIAGYIQLDDHHWNWLSKAYSFRNDEYEWFFLDVNDRPQAACLIYHPNKSVMNPGDIFYIEYVAVAPWNRKNPMSDREYYGAGSEIIKCAMQYAIDSLGLRLGFSLHSLPKAKDFYEKIGMTYLEEHNKDTLNFYEMSEEKAKDYLEAS